jgi:formylglycine-generating enzyme required for sulfatase activity
MNMVGMQATKDSRPIHQVSVDRFFIDKTDVTNGQFVQFVKATGYLTIAEKTPTAEDSPDAPPGNLYAGAAMFSPPNPSGFFERSFSMVELRKRRRLAAPRWREDFHQGKARLSGRPGRLRGWLRREEWIRKKSNAAALFSALMSSVRGTGCELAARRDQHRNKSPGCSLRLR